MIITNEIACGHYWDSTKLLTHKTINDTILSKRIAQGLSTIGGPIQFSLGKKE